VGTNELTRLAEKDKVDILAPLGKVLDLRELVNEELDEIHIVGGGVGIAPLIYLVQVLRSIIKVKAFISVEDYTSSSIKQIQKGFRYTKNAKSIDDLKSFGLSKTDICISFLLIQTSTIQRIKMYFRKLCFNLLEYLKTQTFEN
jgi:hypothetical protein